MHLVPIGVSSVRGAISSRIHHVVAVSLRPLREVVLLHTHTISTRLLRAHTPPAHLPSTSFSCCNCAALLRKHSSSPCSMRRRRFASGDVSSFIGTTICVANECVSITIDFNMLADIFRAIFRCSNDCVTIVSVKCAACSFYVEFLRL
jgi:hypothetical protein